MAEATAETKPLVIPTFKNNLEAQRWWAAESRSRSVPVRPNKYGNMTRDEAKVAYHENRGDLFIRKDIDNPHELYRVVRLRDEYRNEAALKAIRALNVILHPWVNWTGTKA